jgi:hypothetical protein
MVNAGAWRVTNPSVKGHVGFRINTLVSPLTNAAWPILVKEFLEVKNDPARLQVFVNTVLGQAWNDAHGDVDPGPLAERAEDFSLDRIPEEVLYTTAGVDVQKDRVVAVIHPARRVFRKERGRSGTWPGGRLRRRACAYPGEVVTYFQSDSSRTDSQVRVRYAQPGSAASSECGRTDRPPSRA